VDCTSSTHSTAMFDIALPYTLAPSATDRRQTFGASEGRRSTAFSGGVDNLRSARGSPMSYGYHAALGGSLIVPSCTISLC